MCIKPVVEKTLADLLRSTPTLINNIGDSPHQEV